MKLDIQTNSVRGHITTGKYYSNGVKIRLVKTIDYDEIEFIEIIQGNIEGKTKKVKVGTFEQWAKCPVFVNTFE